ncbi:DNA-binding HxlR family transcriptional regulator [Actinomadura rupiterrae]|nr:winged helix-turn-helix transcriptional regulator [Actinomadura rupiterrae]MCP2339270.1 DNA-binding HxlR family transcriptional regulator [Actinomadura rupiterrae]
MLSATLRQLIADGLVRRRVEATVTSSPYRLTEHGLSLESPLAATSDRTGCRAAWPDTTSVLGRCAIDTRRAVIVG